ncbi:MAG: DUF1573 domain-containing protein [Chitinophagales bacterium]
MKKIFTAFLLTVCVGFLVQAQTPVESPSFQWVSEVYDFGNIPQGIPAVASYEFINTGKSALIITDVQKTCGCTNTEWPQEPVMPGQKGTIKATYNAASDGAFTKAITVNSNSSTPSVKLTFKGTVVKESSAPENQTIFNSGN